MTAGRPLSLFVRRDVVALYVDARGPYPGLVAQWFDAIDDATRYAGPLPVVAHPPCGPWGHLRHLSRRDDPALAIRAVEQVRAFGGVLEHPAWSMLWEACDLPKPGKHGELGEPDAHGAGSAVPPGIKVCSAEQRRRTPPAFAAWLLEAASRARR